MQVSRCGMIYMEPSSLGWEPLLASWKNTLPPTLQDHDKKTITDLFMRFCPMLLWFIRKGGMTVSLGYFQIEIWTNHKWVLRKWLQRLTQILSIHS